MTFYLLNIFIHTEWPYSPEDFARMDESDDDIFYEQPRLVYHIDDPAVSALTEYYGKAFNEGDDVLDICSSWVSHYPPDWKGGKSVVGLGMNEYELSQNKQLTSFVVKDLNKDPIFPFGTFLALTHFYFVYCVGTTLTVLHLLNWTRHYTDDESFDKVTCVVSIDYLNKPLEVVKEIGRVLRPGGECILSMSNRW